MTVTLTEADVAALKDAEVSEAAALSLRKQAEGFEAEALALRAGVYARWQTVEPEPEPEPEPPAYDTLPAFKSGAPGAMSVYDLRGQRFNAQLNLRRFSFVHVIGGTYETPDTSFYCDGGTDIIVESATFTGSPMQSSNTQRCRTINSTRVALVGCTVIGGLATNGIAQDAPPPLDSSGNVLGLGAGKGVNIENCTDCEVRECDISLVHKGITVSKSTVAVLDNVIHDIRTTPISGTFGSGSAILGNATRDSIPWGYGGNYDHGDAPIHAWTEGGDIDGLIISNNYHRQGAGAPMIGIFLQSKDGRFTNLVADGNTIETANGQGFRADGCSGVISNTTLVWTDPTGDPKSEPRLDVNAPSRDLLVKGTKGIVTVDEGLINVVVEP